MAVVRWPARNLSRRTHRRTRCTVRSTVTANTVRPRFIRIARTLIEQTRGRDHREVARTKETQHAAILSRDQRIELLAHAPVALTFRRRI
jgi:hypothetical protein